MVGGNKQERLDARGLPILLRNGPFSSFWIPSGKLRDLRKVVRTRMALMLRIVEFSVSSTLK